MSFCAVSKEVRVGWEMFFVIFSLVPQSMLIWNQTTLPRGVLQQHLLNQLYHHVTHKRTASKQNERCWYNAHSWIRYWGSLFSSVLVSEHFCAHLKMHDYLKNLHKCSSKYILITFCFTKMLVMFKSSLFLYTFLLYTLRLRLVQVSASKSTLKKSYQCFPAHSKAVGRVSQFRFSEQKSFTCLGASVWTNSE